MLCRVYYLDEWVRVRRSLNMSNVLFISTGFGTVKQLCTIWDLKPLRSKHGYVWSMRTADKEQSYTVYMILYVYGMWNGRISLPSHLSHVCNVTAISMSGFNRGGISLFAMLFRTRILLSTYTMWFLFLFNTQPLWKNVKASESRFWF